MSTLHVQSKQPSFRRAGFQFTDKEAVVLNTADLSKEQIQALKEEPALVVVETAGKPAKGADKPEGDQKTDGDKKSDELKKPEADGKANKGK